MFVTGTDPTLVDTDADGLDDDVEVAGSTLPLDPDTDDDGLLDGDEVDVYGTDPLVVDSDGGGESDGDEVAAGRDPLNDVDDFGLPWTHTVTVDGDDSDWFAVEEFATSSGGGSATMVTWDGSFLYLGIRPPAVGTGDGADWWMVYVDNGGFNLGTANSVAIGTQQAPLPFLGTGGTWWRADDSYSAALYVANLFGSNQWQTLPSDFTSGGGGSALAYDPANDVMELRIPRSQLDLAGVFGLHAGWVRDASGDERSFGATPDTSFAEDAADPAYTAYLEFDLNEPLGPGAAVIVTP